MDADLLAEGESLARGLVKARRRVGVVTGLMRVWCARAQEAGVSEVEMAEVLGVDVSRSVGRWLGKSSAG